MLKDFWCNCCLGVSHLWLRVLVWDHRQEQVSLEIFQLPRVELFYQQVCVIVHLCVFILGWPLYRYHQSHPITQNLAWNSVMQMHFFCTCTWSTFFARKGRSYAKWVFQSGVLWSFGSSWRLGVTWREPERKLRKLRNVLSKVGWLISSFKIF